MQRPGRRRNPCGAHIVVRPSFTYRDEAKMRGMLLWFLGIPIPIIILLYLFHVI